MRDDRNADRGPAMAEMSPGTALRQLKQAHAGLKKARQLMKQARDNPRIVPAVLGAGWESLAGAPADGRDSPGRGRRGGDDPAALGPAVRDLPPGPPPPAAAKARASRTMTRTRPGRRQRHRLKAEFWHRFPAPRSLSPPEFS